ncbi:carboxypeptidase-like regulatory domain-containing protein [Mucilaginibacter sp. SP1R1]|uniref:carboxypeptidase-like regulatory domain-containing protein n=1 Tax=Mucilaginibacter sp. SP1R1 TaxID=2723091 RepID=UPI00161D1AC5|nr:carboxypeptidase-like regulatory domain-containing protein [Mucilaginibacter sp. SP1R1]MBB6151236.1 TonB-dependent SusC/RagA subfamily outer membrane receptor [Mucilaginibacter sp. SP1R1]
MKYKKVPVVLLIALVSTVILGFKGPGDDLLGKLVDQLYKWRANHPQEKVYLHLDKPYYAVGDDIWFKAYVTIGSKHQLSAFSEILNVDLIDEHDSVKRSLKLPLISGLANGDFALPDTMKEGNYRIRAYTNWMRNEGEAYFFNKTISIVSVIHNTVFTKTAYTYSTQNGKQRVDALINYTDLNGNPYAGNEVTYRIELNNRSVFKSKGVTDDKGNLNASFSTSLNLTASGHIITNIKLTDKRVITRTVPIKAISNKIDVQFFPESGSLVNSIGSKVAFKAVGADGLGTDVKGNIVDEQNQVVTTFNSTHLGMGVFTLRPQSGKSYKAHMVYADGSEGSFDIPKAVDNAYVLSIDNSNNDELAIRILPGAELSNGDTPTGGLMLVGQSGGEIYYASKSADGGKTFTASVAKSKFPSGIVQFTLFSSTGEPLNERVVFIQNPDQLKLAVSATKQKYAPREKVTLNLNAKNSEDKPVIGSFSASVIDLAKVPVDESAEESIYSNVLLSSDLKGYVEKPGYYFADESPTTRADLDVLMLTQGYRRFDWKQVINDTFPPVVYQPEKTLQVSGHLKTFGGKPVANGKITLFTTAGGAFVLDTVSDSQGKFTFNNLIFRDSIKFIVQARTAKDRKNLEIELDNIAPQIVGKNKNAPDIQVNVNDGLSVYMKNSQLLFNEQVKYGIGNHTILLKEVVIKDTKILAVQHSSNLNGAGNADQVITYKDLENTGGQLSNVLQGRLLGVMFRGDTPYSTRGGGPMQIIVDGVYMEAEFLNSVTVSDIASIEVLRTVGNTAIYGSRGGNGVLVITTKRGDEGAVYNRYAPGIVTYAPKGYYKAREFYSPQYDDPKVNTQMQDLRSTIYWRPNIITDKEGNASLSFFNADGKGTYCVVIEGIDGDGKLGRQVYKYKVE